LNPLAERFCFSQVVGGLANGAGALMDGFTNGFDFDKGRKVELRRGLPI
jgi:hypothetical protein